MKLFIVITFFKGINAEMQGNLQKYSLFWTFKDNMYYRIKRKQESKLCYSIQLLGTVINNVGSKNIFYILVLQWFFTQSIFDKC